MFPLLLLCSCCGVVQVNLRKGVLSGEVTHTCTAGAGTLYLEFATLSRLTGLPIFEVRPLLPFLRCCCPAS